MLINIFGLRGIIVYNSGIQFPEIISIKFIPFSKIEKIYMNGIQIEKSKLKKFMIVKGKKNLDIEYLYKIIEDKVDISNKEIEFTDIRKLPKILSEIR